MLTRTPSVFCAICEALRDREGVPYSLTSNHSLTGVVASNLWTSGLQHSHTVKQNVLKHLG